MQVSKNLLTSDERSMTRKIKDIYNALQMNKIMTKDVSVGGGTLRRCIAVVTADYEEKVTGARKRLTNALEIIIMAYYAALIKGYSDSRVAGLMNN